jgi:plastocyanin
MTSIRSAVFSSLVAVVALTTPLAAQDAAHSDIANASMPHTIVIKLVERPGAMPFAFEPATVTAHHGDTLRFVQMAATMHNVHFKTEPKGAKLGSAATSQYLTSKGQAYSLVVDARFVDGTYEIVCDPHEMLGMHELLTVIAGATLVSGK